MEIQGVQNQAVMNQAVGNTDPAVLEKKKRADAANDFEALLIGQMLKSMHEEGSNWLGTGDDQSTDSAFGLAEQQLARSLVSGGGMGVGRRSAAPPKVPPTTVAVTLPSGEVVQGELDHLSAFIVALRQPDGTYRSFARHDSIPKVVVTNPLQWHIDMLPKWRDSDIHNVTAYLVTLK